MIRLLAFAIVALTLSLPLALPRPGLADETPAEPSEAAMAFVGEFSDRHLSGMLSKVGGQQPSMVAISQLHGALVAAVFDGEIDKAVAEHGDEWQRNMALAWMPLMTDEELDSLRTLRSDSPYADKYMESRVAAGEAMQEMSQDLFKEVLEEVIGNTLAELADVPEDGASPATEAPAAKE